MSRPVPNPGILDIAPYTPGKSPVPEAGRKVFKLSANENAVRTLAEGDGSLQARRDASRGLSGRHVEGIARGHRPRLRARSPTASSAAPGSDRNPQPSGPHLSQQGRRGDFCAHASWCTRSRPWRMAPSMSWHPKEFYRRRRCHPETGVAAHQAGLARQPEQPTGTYLPFDEVSGCAPGCRRMCCWCWDAAYADYVSKNDYEIGIELVATTENTVMTHTFSKIHGLAALRIGWMFGRPMSSTP